MRSRFGLVATEFALRGRGFGLDTVVAQTITVLIQHCEPHQWVAANHGCEQELRRRGFIYFL